ncbi:hypothetical protein [Streptomyces lavendulae]|uniref:hypothetical protein n=1 Tax=Streptomyces lavendulae TaxID=1914 RepID=UPI0033E08863
MANDIEIKVRVANQTGAGLTEINRAMVNLRQHARNAGSALDALNPRALAAAASLEVLAHAADEAGDALRRIHGRSQASTLSMTELRAASSGTSTSLRGVGRSAQSTDGRFETLTSRTSALRASLASLDGTMGRAGASMSSMRGSLGSLRTSTDRAADSQFNLLHAALLLTPALLPIAASVAPIIPALGAAGVAAIAFGAAIIPQVKAMLDLSKAEAAYSKAVADSGRNSAAAAKAEAAWLQQVQQASPELRRASAALSVMKDSFKDWSAGLSSATLPVATKSLAVFGALFPKLTPVVQGASAQLDRFVTILAGGIQSPGFDRFMTSFATFATEMLARANMGVLRLTASLSSGKVSSGVGEFMRYAKENGPLVADTLGKLSQALVRLLNAASQTGVSMLTLVNAFAGLVNAIPIGLLSGLLQVVVAFKAVGLASAGLAVVGPRLAAATAGVSAFIRAAAFGGVSSAISGVTQRLSAMAKAGIVVGVLAGIAYGINALAEKARGAPPDVDKLTTSLKNLAATGKFTGELKKTFGDMDGLVERLNKLGEESKKAGEAAKGAFGFKIPVLDDIGQWLGTKFAEMVKGKDSFRALSDEFKALDASLAGMAGSGHADLAAAGFARIVEAAQAGGHSLQEVKDVLPQYGDAVSALEIENQLAAQSMGLFGEQAVAVQAKLDLQKQSANGLAQSINALNNVYLQARGGVREMEAAIDAATESLKENGRNLDENTEKGRANNQALDNLAAATMKASEAALANGEGWNRASEIWERGRGQLLESAQAMGLTQAQARALADQILATPNKTAVLKGNMEDLQAKLDNARQQLRTVPDSRRAQVQANISDLEAKVARAKNDLAGIRDRTVWITTYYMSQSIAHPGGQAQAHGGVIGAAGGGPRSRMTLVGEQGPELVDLAPGSRVRSHPDSKRIADGMAGGGGGGPITIQLMLDGRQVADAIIDPLRYEIRTRGGNVQAALGQAGAR